MKTRRKTLTEGLAWKQREYIAYLSIKMSIWVTVGEMVGSEVGVFEGFEVGSIVGMSSRKMFITQIIQIHDECFYSWKHNTMQKCKKLELVFSPYTVRKYLKMDSTYVAPLKIFLQSYIKFS